MRRLFAVLILCLLCYSVAMAHSGGTDSKGGHYNRSTGEYHYHHGYSAHQHPGGVCPYTSPTKKPSTSYSTASTRSASSSHDDFTIDDFLFHSPYGALSAVGLGYFCRKILKSRS